MAGAVSTLGGTMTHALWTTALASLCVTLVPACRFADATAATANPPAVAWQDWSQATFARARAEGRLVLLDLGASWCHWCHVMDATTWTDADVRGVLANDFVAIEVDADRRLDLANRYQDYGWPALVVFDGDGRELWKHRGFVAPTRLAATLRQLVAAPVPLAEAPVPDVSTPVAHGNALEPDVRATLRARFDAVLDDELGGYAFAQKFLDLAGAEWLLLLARDGDPVARERLLRWLDAERALLDPAFGGAYQYSHGGTWTNPHFEKVMPRQLADLAAYSQAFGAFGRDEDLAAARNVASFLRTMLRAPEGAFHASQDADLEPGQHAADYFARDAQGRREIGLPRIERALWSRENGQAIRGLCALHAVAPDAALLADAVAAAEWILAHRQGTDGLFTHGDDDTGGPFLGDSLEMAAAFAALHDATGALVWLDRAQATVRAIGARFATARGFATAPGDGLLPPTIDRAENLALARVARRVAAVGRDAACSDIAAAAFAAMAARDVALQPGLTADLLLADHELRHDPLHIVVVGAATDVAARELLAVARRAGPVFRHIECVTKGVPTADGTTFPPQDGACAFVCGDGACSPPLPTPERLEDQLAPMRRGTQPNMRHGQK
jgi:uncharacterized protein YyaL (SSP411 family)